MRPADIGVTRVVSLGAATALVALAHGEMPEPRITLHTLLTAPSVVLDPRHQTARRAANCRSAAQQADYPPGTERWRETTPRRM